MIKHSPVNRVDDERNGTETDSDRGPFPGLLRQQVSSMSAKKESGNGTQSVDGESGDGHGGQPLPDEGVCDCQRGRCRQLTLRAHEGGGVVEGGVWRPRNSTGINLSK